MIECFIPMFILGSARHIGINFDDLGHCWIQNKIECINSRYIFELRECLS